MRWLSKCAPRISTLTSSTLENFLNVLFAFFLRFFSFNVDHFWSPCWICYIIVFVFFVGHWGFFAWLVACFGHEVCGDLSSPTRDRTCTALIGKQSQPLDCQGSLPLVCWCLRYTLLVSKPPALEIVMVGLRSLTFTKASSWFWCTPNMSSPVSVNSLIKNIAMLGSLFTALCFSLLYHSRQSGVMANLSDLLSWLLAGSTAQASTHQ